MKYKYVNLTKENLLIIKNIDDDFYKLDIKIDWYLQRYNEKHNAILLYDEDKCVGYIVTVPIKKELYKSFINGVLINDLNINPKMYVNKSKYNYIVSCVILDEYRKKGYGSSLMEKMFSNTSGRYCTLSITKEGFFLANKYMKLKEKINNDVSVFVK